MNYFIVSIHFNRQSRALFICLYEYIIINIEPILGMSQRKPWSSEEDSILKYLIEERGLTKWSQISQILEQQYKILNRNGKQCRERYHNHLDHSINNSQWTIQEENLLFNMQQQIGNKWATISSKLSGRTDNCVKNHFYSKLRKSLRKINKKIHKWMKREYRDIKTSTLYKIIETLQSKNKNDKTIEGSAYELCKKIKKQLREYKDEAQEFPDQNQEVSYVRLIIEDIALFDKQIKKNPKKTALKSSAKLSEDDNNLKQHSYSNKVSSTKSVCDDQSQSCSNSQLFSSSSFDHHSFGSQTLTKQSKIFRSQSIKSELQNQSSDQDAVLFHSANSLYTKKQATKEAQPPPAPISEKQKQIASDRSNKSQNSSDEECNRMYMWGEESLEMRVISPKRLTFQQKMQMTDENDKLFYGKMEVQNSELEHQRLIDDFSGMKIGLFGIPKLGKGGFD